MKESKPALSAAEWKWHGDEIVEGIALTADLLAHPDGEPTDPSPSDLRHQLAALALCGQPFGFTRKDVSNLRAYVRNAFGPLSARHILDLADRIEALLPPKEPRK